MASFSINAKSYNVEGPLTPMNIAKAVNREEGERVSVRALAQKLKVATGSDGLDALVTHMDAVNFGPRDYVRLFGTSDSGTTPSPRRPAATTPRSANDSQAAPLVPMDLERTLHGLERDPGVAASGPKRGEAKVVSGSSEVPSSGSIPKK